jgi:hypothetical protein
MLLYIETAPVNTIAVLRFPVKLFVAFCCFLAFLIHFTQKDRRNHKLSEEQHCSFGQHHTEKHGLFDRNFLNFARVCP